MVTYPGVAALTESILADAGQQPDQFADVALLLPDELLIAAALRSQACAL